MTTFTASILHKLARLDALPEHCRVCPECLTTEPDRTMLHVVADYTGSFESCAHCGLHMPLRVELKAELQRAAGWVTATRGADGMMQTEAQKALMCREHPEFPLTAVCQGRPICWKCIAEMAKTTPGYRREGG